MSIDLGLNAIRDAAHSLASEKGFYDGFQHTATDICSKLALLHSEVSEAVQEVRDGRELHTIQYRADGKPAGFPIELADIILRTLDLAGALGIDIDTAVAVKHGYNETRPYKHGKAI
jgi:NTP pyrophosphatase (non-canonical NTP hydrolase)